MARSRTPEHARDYAKVALKYAREATRDTKQVRHCKWVRLACQRHLRDLERAKADPDFPYRWDPWHAADVCDFVEKLPHVEGQWDSPTIVMQPHQVFRWAILFGWRRKDNGARRFGTAYIEMARKNAKSTEAASVLLYCYCCEDEVGPQIKCAATTGDQARIVFNVAKRMVERTPDLREAFALEVLANSIECHANSGNFRPINAKSSTQDGLNPHAYVIDELHAHRDRGLFDVLHSSQGARRNPLRIYITTAGFFLDGVCYEERTYLTKVLEGVLEDDSYFGIIYTLDGPMDYDPPRLGPDEKPIGDDPWDAKVWIKPNPNLGVSKSLIILGADANKARHSPQEQGAWKTKDMNLWLNAPETWLNMERWDRCADRTLRLEDFAGQPCWIGGDLADRNDITAAALVFWHGVKLVTFPFFWLARECLEDRGSKVAHYHAWAKAGLLTLTEGGITDYGLVERHIRAWWGRPEAAAIPGPRFDVQAAKFDQYGSAQLTSNLMTDGLTAVVETWNKSVTEPAKELESRVEQGLFAHDGNPMLRWMASNAVVSRYVDGSIIPKKESQNSPHKIDGIVAVIHGISLAIAAQPKSAPSIEWF